MRLARPILKAEETRPATFVAWSLVWERDETEQAKACRIIEQELKRLGWSKVELKRRRKGDTKKVALARRLPGETAVSLGWIAQNLHMGTWTHVSNRLYHSPR